MDWSAKALNRETFTAEIESREYPVFVDFWAAWCPPCRMMDPVIKQLAERYREKVIIRKLNTDLYRKIAKEYNVSGIPTYILFKDGREIWRHVGAVSRKKLEEVLDEIAGK